MRAALSPEDKHASDFEGLPGSAAGGAAVKLVFQSASSAVVVATVQEPAGGYQLLEKRHFHIYSLAAASPLKDSWQQKKWGGRQQNINRLRIRNENRPVGIQETLGDESMRTLPIITREQIHFLMLKSRFLDNILNTIVLNKQT